MAKAIIEEQKLHLANKTRWASNNAMAWAVRANTATTQRELSDARQMHDFFAEEEAKYQQELAALN